MADFIIKNDPQLVEQCAGKIKTQMTMMENFMSEMLQQVNSLQDHFKSTSGADYIQKYQNVNRDINNSITEIGAVVTAMEQAANELRSADQKADAKVDSLNTQSVFMN